MLPQLLINTFVTFAQYSLVGYGYILAAKYTKIPHFAYGALVGFGAYICWFCIAILDLNLILSIFITFLFSTLISLLVFKIIYLPFWLKQSSNSVLLLLSLSLIIVIENLIQILFSSSVKILNFSDFNQLFRFQKATFTLIQLTTFGINIFVFILLFFLIYKTRIGLQWRALSQNTKLFQSSGFNLKTGLLAIFGFAGLLGGLASVVVAFDFALTPALGTMIFLKSFVAAALVQNELKWFGLTCLGLSTFETIFVWFFPSGWKDVLVYSFLVLWLLLKNLKFYKTVN